MIPMQLAKCRLSGRNDICKYIKYKSLYISWVLLIVLLIVNRNKMSKCHDLVLSKFKMYFRHKYKFDQRNVKSHQLSAGDFYDCEYDDKNVNIRTRSFQTWYKDDLDDKTVTVVLDKNTNQNFPLRQE